MTRNKIQTKDGSIRCFRALLFLRLLPAYQAIVFPYSLRSSRPLTHHSRGQVRSGLLFNSNVMCQKAHTGRHGRYGIAGLILRSTSSRQFPSAAITAHGPWSLVYALKLSVLRPNPSFKRDRPTAACPLSPRYAFNFSALPAGCCPITSAENR